MSSSFLGDHKLLILLSAISGFSIGYLASRLVSSSKSSTTASSLGTASVRQDASKTRDKSSHYSTLLELEEAFRITKYDLEKICLTFIEHLERGLIHSNSVMQQEPLPNNAFLKERKAPHQQSTLPMLPTFVERLPSGTEEGTYFAIDFGGTHVRIIKVDLFPREARPSTPLLQGHHSSSYSSSYNMIQKKMIIPERLKTGSGYALFDYIAQGVKDFLEEHPLTTEKSEVPLGFTFSFGVEQTSINAGVILGWTKDFNCHDVVGKDPVALLQDALAKKRLTNIKVVALVNDTTGTLVAHAFSEPSTQIAVILGTGSNAAYNEAVSKIKKLDIRKKAETSSMLINTEFGAFNPNEGKEPHEILPRTKYDLEIDSRSQNPQRQIYEKLISGHYLGEIVRVVLVNLIKSRKLFRNVSTYTTGEDQSLGILGKPNSFDTSYMSRIERDHSGTLADTKRLLQDIFQIKHFLELSDLRLIKFVCELVAIRSARLASAAIAGLVHHLGLARLLITQVDLSAECSDKLPADDPIFVAVDGSLFEHYPHYYNRMMDAFRELFGSKADSVRLCLAKDGSGLGAALIASLAGHPSAEATTGPSNHTPRAITPVTRESPKEKKHKKGATSSPASNVSSDLPKKAANAVF